jgi:hypothetical protein
MRNATTFQPYSQRQIVTTDRSNNKLLMRRIRSWIRSPGFYARKAKERVFGINATFLRGERESYPVGSYEWLALTEALYGGLQLSGVTSKKDRGGDRMSPYYHSYGRCYAEFLKPFISTPGAGRLTVTEVGILNGSGLAIWCDLFPNARVIGFDIDLSNFQANRKSIERAGAFQVNVPEVHTFDQLNSAKASDVLHDVLGEDRVNIGIDDGCHSIESIEITFEAIRPFLAAKFVYFIEDNFDAYDYLALRHRGYSWTTRGEIAVATNLQS